MGPRNHKKTRRGGGRRKWWFFTKNSVVPSNKPVNTTKRIYRLNKVAPDIPISLQRKE